MKKIAAVTMMGFLALGCGEGVKDPENDANTAVSARKQDDSAAVSSRYDAANQAAQPAVERSETKTKWTQSGDPIDVSKFDSEIAKYEKQLKTGGEKAKKNLAEAYFQRGFALTEARQYASALGDYRRAIKHDADHEMANVWLKKIVAIYNGMNKAYPNEGEEPPPLPFKAEK